MESQVEKNIFTLIHLHKKVIFQSICYLSMSWELIKENKKVRKEDSCNHAIYQEKGKIQEKKKENTPSTKKATKKIR